MFGNPSSPYFELALGDIRRRNDTVPDAYVEIDYENYEKVDENYEKDYKNYSANVYLGRRKILPHQTAVTKGH